MVAKYPDSSSMEPQWMVLNNELQETIDPCSILQLQSKILIAILKNLEES